MVHWYQLWWLIFPVMGMCMGYVRLWQDHQREKQVIDLLKTYAEKGAEPPPAVLEALKAPVYGRRCSDRKPWPSMVFFAAMAMVFVGVALALRYRDESNWVFILIPAGIFVALSLMMMVRGLTSGRDET